ncbi:hypothetical protein [Lactococcus lactis]|uniref:Uncharacterized protein n=1 Tax=Lactococcus lactis TaxID=1358 RepID=A0AAP8E0S6_9LACT|nr:hypothetical protein [Lactococcus lactis]MDG4971400.1 hypothetical protein [Lactococcus lactis]PFG88823.1 hypothetical protein BW154_04840 [Lactococcus lactis]
MSYEKQTWNKYDELKTEEENIENGAVVTDNRMNHIENGIGDNNTNLASHLANTNNPHKVTAAQVGLDKVDNVKQASKAEFDSHTSDASNPHKVTASQVGSYSKSESDDKLATQKQAMDSHVNNKANPHAVTASQVGAYSKQEIDTKLSKAVMADDSGKVIIKDLVASSITLPNDTNGWITLQNLHYKKKNGLVSFWFDFTTTASGTAIVGTFPDGFIPPNDVMFVIVNWTTTTASSKVLQLTGLNSSINTGLVGILNAAANTRYTGHFTFSV